MGQPVFGLLANLVDKCLMLAAAPLGAAATTFGYVNAGDALGLALLGPFRVFNFSGFPLLRALVAHYVLGGGSTTANAFVWGPGSTGGQALGPWSSACWLLVPTATSPTRLRSWRSSRWRALPACSSCPAASAAPSRRCSDDRGPRPFVSNGRNHRGRPAAGCSRLRRGPGVGGERCAGNWSCGAPDEG